MGRHEDQVDPVGPSTFHDLGGRVSLSHEHPAAVAATGEPSLDALQVPAGLIALRHDAGVRRRIIAPREQTGVRGAHHLEEKHIPAWRIQEAVEVVLVDAPVENGDGGCRSYTFGFCADSQASAAKNG